MSAADNIARMRGMRTLLQPEVILGLRLQVTMDSSDQRFLEKYGALRRAVELVSRAVPNAFLECPNPLPVLCGADVRCEACWEPERLGGKVSLFLGDRMMFQTNRVVAGQDRVYGQGQQGPRGVADQLYDDMRKSKISPARWWFALNGRYQASKVSAKAIAVVVHEIGHILHEQRSQIRFWNNKRVGAAVVPAALAENVSSYLIGNNLDEFVAEVFTGLVHGKAYGAAILDEYERQGGPRVR